ncbi:hypothetical protein C2E23DRAFT_259695 [Lenzites betulinus]|nr:hypothetical protein C2E23DRAFT_259695 [Lenzites betulinus]
MFETNELAGSAGVPVRIHRTAWEGIGRVLSCVTVRAVPAEESAPKPTAAAETSMSHISTQKSVAIPSIRPMHVPSMASSSNAFDLPSAATRGIQNRVVTPTASSANASRNVSKASASKTAQLTPKATVPPKNVLSRALSSSKPPPYVQTPEQSTDEEEEEEIRIISPIKKRVARPRVLSDYGLADPDDEPADTISARRSEIAEEEEAEEYDELDDAEYISAAPPVVKTPLSSQSTQTRGLSAAKPASSRGGSRPLVQLDALPSTLRTSDRAPSPQVKLEKAPAKLAAPASQDVTPSQSQGKSDESFVIMIEYNDDPESRSLFKTRGRHMVSKVLMQACRTFGIEDYYDSARLILLVEADGDVEGETVVYRAVCNRNETMAEAGSERDARFVVEIVDGDDNA